MPNILVMQSGTRQEGRPINFQSSEYACSYVYSYTPSLATHLAHVIKFGSIQIDDCLGEAVSGESISQQCVNKGRQENTG